MAINPAQFDAVVDALRRVLPCERPADAVLSAYFRDMRKLGAQDRHLIAETIFAVLRRRAFLTALTAPSATPRRLVIASLIKVRGLNVRELDGILTEAEKKWVVELKAAFCLGKCAYDGVTVKVGDKIITGVTVENVPSLFDKEIIPFIK